MMTLRGSLHRLGLLIYPVESNDKTIEELEKELFKQITCMAHILNHPEMFDGVDIYEQIDLLRNKLQEYDLHIGNLKEI